MPSSDEWFDEAFADERILVIARGLGVERSLQMAEQSWDLGVTMLELPIQSATDVEALANVAAAGRERGLVVGAGTILTPDQVLVARDAGAVYTVSPGADEAVIRASLDAGLPTLPGVATASDIQRCRGFGLHWLKAFPASVLGPEWISAMNGPFPEVRFVATGGVSAANARSFVDAGVRVVGLGSSLADPAQLEEIKRAISPTTGP
ncbi:bifunctional 4-hydroxy-2-oxoglutarate aldolase/2-dehydro-3-deoxy-phosphogluconate aldolase [Microbacterium pumilum]|uniref:Bifunctional 4-hydroxy-2-oxoglutarate aldolase/2-dehydro-3-deoxy-phosphogluconate aldolase n=1 Tax=Microbacterium pumilum TaxID=344165 RepID=A0ABN2S6Z6_9MICO